MPARFNGIRQNALYGAIASMFNGRNSAYSGLGAATAVANSPPTITAGPTWTNNQDGTVTFAVTTDVATTLVLDYDTAGTYLIQQTDTSKQIHSITFDCADGAQLFRCTVTANALDTVEYGVGAVTSLLLSQFWIPGYYVDVSAVNYLYRYARRDDPTKGVSGIFIRSTPDLVGQNPLRVLDDRYDTEMRPGQILPWASDASSGAVSTLTDANTQFQTLTTGQRDWNVTVTADKLIYSNYSNPGDGSESFDVYRVRSGVETLALDNATPVSYTHLTLPTNREV